MHGLREKQAAPPRVEVDEAVTPPLPDGGASVLGLGVGPARDLFRASDIVRERPRVERRRSVRAPHFTSVLTPRFFGTRETLNLCWGSS